MNEQQSLEENRAAFVARLIEAGWSQKEAEEEWENVQGDEEDGL